MTDESFVQLVARLDTYEEFKKTGDKTDNYDAIDTLHTLIMVSRDMLAEAYELCHT